MRNNSNPSTEARSLILTEGNGNASTGDRIYGTDVATPSLAATSGGLGAATGLYFVPTIRCTDPKQGGPGDTVPIVCHENISGQHTPGANARALRTGASHNYQFVCAPEQPEPIVFQRNRGDDGRGYTREPCIRTDGTCFSVTSSESLNVCAASDPDRMRTPSGIPGRLDLYVPGTALGGCTCADGPRYRSLGNAVATVVIVWIGNRIMRYLEGEGKTTGQST